MRAGSPRSGARKRAGRGFQRARRGILGVASAAGLALAQPCAWGAEPPPEPAAEYVDRLMPDAPELPELADDGAIGFDPSGSSRALRIETRAQASSNDSGREASAWISLRGAVDTANYGAFSVDASARLFEHRSGQRRGGGLSFSLYQTAMPFGGGWYASQGLGVVQTLSPRTAALQASFFLPTRLVQGASTSWRNESQGVSLQLSGGETGSFSSIGQGSFYSSGDRVAAVGLELLGAGQEALLPRGWAYSAIASGASGSSDRDVPGLGVRSGEPAGRGLFQSLRWESDSAFVQGNLLASRNEDVLQLSQQPLAGTQSSRAGAWLDGAWQNGEITQRWGLHRLAPNLSWQGSALGGNTLGGYYRWSRVGLRDQIDAQLSSTRPVDAAAGGMALHQAGVSWRRYVDQQLGLGGVVQVSGGGTTALQASGYAELHRAWADLRWQAGFETSEGQLVARRLASDQAWVLPIGLRFSTSQALSWTRSLAQDANGAFFGESGSALELAASGGADVGDRVSLDLNARISAPLSSQAARVYNLSASGQWRFARGWSLGATLSMSRASGLTTTAPAPPIPGLPGTFVSYVYPGTNTRDAWLTLRYDFQAGTAVVPSGAGGRVGVGGGDVEGVVYLDENRNGRLDALETRAANVTVVLDGRYTTRTDAQGRFEFPFVASGPHTVKVASDTLPLPWSMPPAEALRVDVVPREKTRLDIGATRDRAGLKDE